MILRDANDAIRSLCVDVLLIKQFGLLSVGGDGTGGPEVVDVLNVDGGRDNGALDCVVSMLGFEIGIGGGVDGISGCATLGGIDGGTGGADKVNELGKGGTTGGGGGTDFESCVLILTAVCDRGTLLEVGCEEAEEREEEGKGAGCGGKW